MNHFKIDKDFVNKIRLDISTGYFLFEDKTEIIPKELTHDFLLRKFNIDKDIYKYYHLPTSRLLSESEFQEMKSTGFTGKKETALRPYSINIYGAYFSRSNLITKLSSIIYSNNKNCINGKKIIYFTDLKPYFKEYAKGFENGFNEFDNTQIKPFLTMLAEKQDYINKVFEYITKTTIMCRWTTINGLATRNNEIVNAFENGQQQGYYYRAWSIVFSNNNLFTPLFQEYFKALPPQQSQFSVLEWATIFYYADETKLLPESKATKKRWEQFMKKHNINTTSDTFKKYYYNAKKRINEKNDFPIDKLNLIIPFTKENYSQAVTKIENDITFLESEQTEY